MNLRTTLLILALVIPSLGNAGFRGLMSAACPLRDLKTSVETKPTPRKKQAAQEYRWREGDKTYKVSIDLYPHSGGKLLTRLIRIHEVKSEDASSLPEVSDTTLMEWIEPNIKFTENEYKSRRKWPESFRKKLREMAKRYLAYSTYVTVFNKRSGMIVGSMRMIRVPAGEKLPVEEYLDVTFDQGLAKEKVEIGTFAIEPTLPASERSKIWLELWLQLMRDTFGSGEGEGKYLDQRFYTYADELSKRMYLPLGFAKVESLGSIHKEGIEWWPLEFSVEKMRERFAQLESKNISSTELERRLREIEGEDFGETLATLFPMKQLLKELETADEATVEILANLIARNLNLMRIGYERFEEEEEKGDLEKVEQIARFTDHFHNEIVLMLHTFKEGYKTKKRTYRRNLALLAERLAGANFSETGYIFTEYMIPTFMFDRDRVVRKRGLNALTLFFARPDFLQLSPMWFYLGSERKNYVMISQLQQESLLHLMREFKGDQDAAVRFVLKVFIPGLVAAIHGRMNLATEIFAPYKHFKSISWSYAAMLAWPALLPESYSKFLASQGITAEQKNLIYTLESNFLDQQFGSIYRARTDPEGLEERRRAHREHDYTLIWLDDHFGI